MENLTGKELIKALGDLGKRIPVVKLERVETLYPTVKNAQKSVTSCGRADENKTQPSNVNRESESRIKGDSNVCGRSVFLDSYSKDCQADVSVYLEPPKKQYRLKEESASCDSLQCTTPLPDHLSVVLQEGKIANTNSVVKSEVVTVECDPNALLTFQSNDEHAVDLLSLSKNKTERKRSGTKSLVLPGNNGTGTNMPKFSGSDMQMPGNIRPGVEEPRFSVNSKPLSYSVNNESGINPVAYSRDKVSGINPPPFSEISRPHLNPHMYGGNNGPGMNTPVYSGPSNNRSAYPGNSGPGLHSSAYSGNNGRVMDSALYPVYNRPGYTPPVSSGNSGLGINYVVFSESDKSELNSSYVGNNGLGINSLTFSASRPIMVPSTYYGDNGSGINPHTYSGNGPRVNSLAYSENNCPGIATLTYSGNNESGINTLNYSSNSGGTVNLLSYSGNKEPVVNSQTYPLSSRVGLNSQTYTGNNGPGIISSSYSGNSGLGIKSPAYPEDNGSPANSSGYSRSSGAGMNPPAYSGNSGSGVNSSVYSGNNGSGVNQIRFAGGSSFADSEMGRQYEILQNYCEGGESRVDNMTCQESTWSNDFITLSSLPTNGYEVSDCLQDLSFLFSCRVCGSVSAVADELVKHWRQHTGVESLTCTVCYVSFTDVLFLQAHWKATHMGGVCCDSGVVLRNEPEFVSHLVCEACGFAFAQFSALEQHVMSTHIPITHRENVSWKSGNSVGLVYNINNTQQTSITNSKSPQGSPVVNNHSLTKQFSILKSDITGSSDHDQSVIELENNVLGSSIAEHSMIRHQPSVANNVAESDDELGEEKIQEGHPMSSEGGKAESVSGQNGKIFKCKVCGCNTYDVNELVKHWRIHIGANTITCTICKKTYSDLPFLQAHWKRSHMQGNPVPNSVSRNPSSHSDSSFMCDACGYAFPDFLLLEQHLLSTHVTAGSTHVPLKNWNCADSIQSVHKPNITTDKNKSLDLITLRIQVMNHCKKKDTEKQPEANENKEGQNIEEMEETVKKISNKYNDSGSKRTKNPDWCLVCGETSDDMIKHLVTHTGVLSLECCLCGKDFVDIPFLQAHWRATHMNGEVCHINNCIYVGNHKENVSCKEKLLCETCGCYVPQFSALEKHIILTHTVVKPPYECKCDDVFASEDELKRHILTCSWRRHQCYSSLTKKDMFGELHNVDKSVQIETNYNKCGIVELHGFEILTE